MLMFNLFQKDKLISNNINMQGVRQFEEADILNIEQSSNKDQLSESIRSKGIINDTLSTLIVNLYQLGTLNSFSVKQKLKAINLTLSILKALIATKTKEQLVIYIDQELRNLGKRNQQHKLAFTQGEIQLLDEFYKEKIVAFYELYEMVLDQNPHFKFEAKEFNIVKEINEKGLQQGTAVEVENIPILKEFLGIRAPKEEKKDPKKK